MENCESLFWKLGQNIIELSLLPLCLILQTLAEGSKCDRGYFSEMNKGTLKHVDPITSIQEFSKYRIAVPSPQLITHLKFTYKLIKNHEGLKHCIPAVRVLIILNACSVCPKNMSVYGELGEFLRLNLRVLKLYIWRAKIHNGKYTQSCCF